MVERQKSNLRQQVALRDVRFFAYHGFYEEERITGNEFFVDVKVWFTPHQRWGEKLAQTSSQEPNVEAEPHTEEDISLTVNYEVLYRIVREEMEQTRQLLETVVEKILEKCVLEFPFLEKAQVRIRKTNPPLGADQAASSVQLTWKKGRQ